jgi:hypothetical protein
LSRARELDAAVPKRRCCRCANLVLVCPGFWGKEAAHRVALPAGHLHDSGDCGPFHVRRQRRFMRAILAGAAAAEQVVPGRAATLI